jgi:5-methylcytosine-specific restriction endonuclease McrBC regulatory subunit McrC
MRVTEHTPTALRLAPEDLGYLLELVRRTGGTEESRVLEALTPTRDPSVYEVTPGAYVGRLGLPSGDWIDFASRFSFDDVIELIRVSGRLQVRTSTLAAPLGSAPFLAEVIAMAFVQEADRLVSRGLSKGYRSVRMTRPPYAGRLDVLHHVAHMAARPDRLATIARRLSTNTPENQALAYAHEILRRTPLSRETSRGLAKLAPVFARVSARAATPMQVASIRLTNLTTRYREALGLAELIIRAHSLAPEGGGRSGVSLLFHMPKVWESYVAQWVRTEWTGYRVDAPYRFALASDGQTAEADITVWDGTKLLALYDAKYKWPQSAPARDDLYQMVTYCERLGIAEATLVYPFHTPERTVWVGSRRVRVVGLRPRFGMKPSALRSPSVPSATIAL